MRYETTTGSAAVGGSAKIGTSSPCAPSPPTRTIMVCGRLENAIRIQQNAIEMMTSHADRLFGPIPESNKAGINKAIDGSSSFGMIEVLLERLESDQQVLESVLTRFLQI